MKHLLASISVLTIGLSLAGCDRGNESKPANAPAAAPPANPAPATANAANAKDPAYGDAGLHLNEAKEFIDTGKFDEADAKLKQVEAVKDHLPDESVATLRRYQMLSRVGRQVLDKANKKQPE